MAYLAGNIITAADYNSLASQVNAIIATKYGQTPIATVAASAVISATQWATLLNGVTTASNVQGSTITAITNPVATNSITHLPDLEANIAVIEAAGASGDAAAVGTPITAGGSIDRATSWNDSVSMPTTVTFGSVTEMNNFFNAGGILKLTFSRSGGTANAKNTGWSALCTAAGTINLTGAAASKTIAGVVYTGTTKTGGSGTTSVLATTIGAFALTGSDQLIFRQFDASAQYTSNAIEVNAKVSGAVITLTAAFTDDANAASDEIVDGTLNTSIVAVPPSTTYLSNTWGTPTLGGSETGALNVLNTPVTAGSFVVSDTYKIETVGTTDFTLIGGTEITTGAFTVGQQYIISVVGDTDFTLSGASANTVDTIFIATGDAGGGTTGRAYETVFVATGAGTGTGTAMPLVTAANLVTGTTYTIASTGTTDFTLIGALGSSVGTIFVADDGTRTAGAFVVGVEYQIVAPGDTDFTLIGALDSLAGTIFTATGAGTGTGTAIATQAGTGTGTAELTTSAAILATEMIAGQAYTVEILGDSNFVLVGAATNTVGEAFTPTGNLVTSGSFVVGKEYTITTDGTTNYALIGASAVPVGGALAAGHTWVGEDFIATGIGAGTGTATETGSIGGTGEAAISQA